MEWMILMQSHLNSINFGQQTHLPKVNPEADNRLLLTLEIQ